MAVTTSNGTPTPAQANAGAVLAAQRRPARSQRASADDPIARRPRLRVGTAFPTWLLARLVLVPRRAGFFAPRSVRASAVVLSDKQVEETVSHSIYGTLRSRSIRAAGATIERLLWGEANGAHSNVQACERSGWASVARAYARGRGGLRSDDLLLLEVVAQVADCLLYTSPSPRDS